MKINGNVMISNTDEFLDSLHYCVDNEISANNLISDLLNYSTLSKKDRVIIAEIKEAKENQIEQLSEMLERYENN